MRKSANPDAADWIIYERLASGKAKNRLNIVTGEQLSERKYRERVSEGQAKRLGITLEQSAERTRIHNRMEPDREDNNPKHPEWVNQVFLIHNRENRKFATTLDSLPFVQDFLNRYVIPDNPKSDVWIVAYGRVKSYEALNRDEDEEDEDEEEETGTREWRTLVDMGAANTVASRWNTSDTGEHRLAQFHTIEKVVVRFKVPV